MKSIHLLGRLVLSWAQIGLGIATVLGGGARAADTAEWKFAFGRPVPGFTSVAPDDVYTATRGFGFDLGSKVAVVPKGGCLTAGPAHAFFFSAKLAPGAYRVRVTLGDATAASTTTVK